MRHKSQQPRPGSLLGLSVCMLLTLSPMALAQSNSLRIGFSHPRTERWVVGVEVQSPGRAAGINATASVPMPWPEQKVKIVETQKSAHVSAIRYRTIGGGTVRQMVILIPQLNPGETAHAMVTFDVTRSLTTAPTRTADLVIPAESPAAVRRFLSASPGIESGDPRIKQLAQEIQKPGLNDWQQTEAIYDWVRENITYQFDEQLKGARAALESGKGDCEELTSLFVALCRARGIPARSVWIPGHCYPEFYLHDAAGQGHWFPCQAAGSRAFGSMPEYRPVLQKGDRIRVPGISQPQRYVYDRLKATSVTAPLNVKFTRQKVKPLDNP